MKFGVYKMIIQIESYKGDTLLYGKNISPQMLKKQMQIIEEEYDKVVDNFISLLCRRYQWSITDVSRIPEYIYDRDTGRLLIIRS